MRRRDFLRAGAAAGLAGGLGVAAATSGEAGVLDELKYRVMVPEVFRPIPDAPAHTQAIVIGSGFGGAIAAYRLAKAGVRTTVLERGSRWPRSATREIFANDAKPDGRGYWHRTGITNLLGLPTTFDDFGGVLDATDYDGIQVWRGACVGGGSVVYTGVSIEPEKRFFESAFAGTGVDHDEMHRVHYPLARKLLAVSPMPEDVYRGPSFAHSRTWDAQARAAGYSPQRYDGIWNWDVVRAETKGRSRRSVTIGESNLGNGNGAKYDLTQNYLAWAERTGRATVYPGHLVHAVGRDGDKYLVMVQKLDPVGKVLKTFMITCDQLYLAGGSIGTTELLMRGRGAGSLPDLNEHVGTGWGTNGDAALVRGLSFTGGSGQGSASASRILDEKTAGVPVSLENWFVPGLSSDMGLIGSLGMVLDSTRADFSYDLATDTVKLLWPRTGSDRAVAALRAVQDKIVAAGGAAGVPVLADVNSSFTAHPLGGAVLGKATDSYGRVRGYRGLYVMDGAGIPGSTGTANPSLTIAALAERNIAAIIAAGG